MQEDSTGAEIVEKIAETVPGNLQAAAKRWAAAGSARAHAILRLRDTETAQETARYDMSQLVMDASALQAPCVIPLGDGRGVYIRSKSIERPENFVLVTIF